MPAGDRTGPMGTGAMTGRRAGYCSGFGAPGYTSAGPGRRLGPGFRGGFGRARGFGRGFSGGGFGWRNRFYAAGPSPWAPVAPVYYTAPDPEAEKQGLKQQAQALESELEMIRKRLDEMESASS